MLKELEIFRLLASYGDSFRLLASYQHCVLDDDHDLAILSVTKLMNLTFFEDFDGVNKQQLNTILVSFCFLACYTGTRCCR